MILISIILFGKNNFYANDKVRHFVICCVYKLIILTFFGIILNPHKHKNKKLIFRAT